MSNYRKDELETKLTTLIAEKNVLDWKNGQTNKPTEENYETQKRYYDGLWQQNQDAIINALNNGTLKIGTEEWRAIMNKSGDLRGQKEAFHMGKMGMLDGEKAVTASEQAATVPAGHEYAAGTRGVGFNPEHMYAKGTGGVTRNYKPRDLREAEGAVDIYNNAFDRIGQLTGETEPSAIMANIQELTRGSGVLDDDSVWGQAARILEDAEERTAMTYQSLLGNLKVGQKQFEEYKRKAAVAAEAKERIAELEDNPEFSLIDWTNDSVDLLSEWQKEMKPKEIDTIINSNYDDLTPAQFLMRSEYDSQNIVNGANSKIEAQLPLLKQLEQIAINDGLTYFDEALEKWIEGDDSVISNLVLDMYDGTKNLVDIEDFNALRNEYVQSIWEEYEKEFLTPLIDERDQALAKTEKAIDEHFKEIINFKENENGYSFELPPELIEFAIGRAEKKEINNQIGGYAAGASGIIVGTAIAAALISIPAVGPFLGLALGVLLDTAAFKIGNDLYHEGDIWDDVALELKHYVDSDKPLIIVKDGNDVDIIEKE